MSVPSISKNVLAWCQQHFDQFFLSKNGNFIIVSPKFTRFWNEHNNSKQVFCCFSIDFEMRKFIKLDYLRIESIKKSAADWLCSVKNGNVLLVSVPGQSLCGHLTVLASQLCSTLFSKVCFTWLWLSSGILLDLTVIWLLDQKHKIASDQQTLSLCNWDTFFCLKISQFWNFQTLQNEIGNYFLD